MKNRTKPLLSIAVVTVLCVACYQNNPTDHVKLPLENANSTELVEAEKSNEQLSGERKRAYKNIDEVIQDDSYSKWGELKDGTSSLALCFWYKDTLLMAYSMECYLLFPYKKEDNKIVVYWDENIDTKYDFDLVKTVRSMDKSYIGKPFMILEIENDTTLFANYPMKDLIRNLNNSSNRRTFFPEKYALVPEDFF